MTANPTSVGHRKVCSQCGIEKALDEFHRDSRSVDVHACSCKVCAKQRARHWYQANRDKAREKEREYRRTARGRETRRKAQRRYAQSERGLEMGRQKARRWAAANPQRLREIRRRASLKANYGLTESEHAELIAKGCAICGTHEGRICVDHDHANGKVRAALCEHCNRGLGCFRDDPELFSAATEYLKAHCARK